MGGRCILSLCFLAAIQWALGLTVGGGNTRHATVVINKDYQPYYFLGSESLKDVESVKTQANDALCKAKHQKPQAIGDWNRLWTEVPVNEFNQKLRIVDDSELQRRQFFCIGFAEGLLTSEEINAFHKNMRADWFTDFKGSPSPEPIYRFLQDNYEFTAKQAKLNRNRSKYWKDVDLVIAQLEGLFEGYLTSMKGSSQSAMKLIDFLFVNADGDLQNLVDAFSVISPGKSRDMNDNRIEFWTQRESRCSALIKIMPDGDVLVGHTTWDHFENLGPRFLKSLIIHGDSARSFIMSSSPAMLSSVDDFFVTGSNMVVLETTNNVYNKSLYKALTPESLLSWIRARVANQESSPAKWAETFSKLNSGTYNNQWMIVDAKSFLDTVKSGSTLGETETPFLVLEQLPGHIEQSLEVEYVISKGYWASYNIPYFPRIYGLSNYSQQVPADEFSHEQCPRAKIFEREIEAGRVEDFEGFKRILRFNDFKNDPFSKGNACLSISSRCDLNEVTSPIYKASGGMDCKVVSLKEVAKGLDHAVFHAQLGPTYDEQSPFVWKDLENRLSAKNIAFPTHTGQNEKYDFQWTTFGSKNINVLEKVQEENSFEVIEV